MSINEHTANDELSKLIRVYNRGVVAVLNDARFSVQEKQHYFETRFQCYFFYISEKSRDLDPTWYDDNKEHLLDELTQVEMRSNQLRVVLLKNERELRLLKIELMSKAQYALYQLEEGASGLLDGLIFAI